MSDGWPDFKKTLGGWPLAWESGKTALFQVRELILLPIRYLKRELF